MEQENQVSSDYPSLLMLNNDCFYPILKLLQFEDFANLAGTCSRLFFVAQKCKKFKNIEVTSCGSTPPSTVQELSNNLSVIGEHVASVYVYHGNDDIFKRIVDACTNLRSVELLGCSIAALPFRNLSEFKVWHDVYLSTDEWKNFFEDNSGIVSLQYCHNGRNKCLALLQMLPELKSLTVCDSELKQFATCCNQIFIELAVKSKLVELEFWMPCDADTFVELKSFRCLEVLSIINVGKFIRIPETAIFPSTLKKIKLDHIAITCSFFLSMLKQLKLLEEFDIGRGHIVWGNDETEYFPTPSDRSADFQGSRIISRIANELRAVNRKIKIIFCEYFCQTHQVWKYFDNLEIIQCAESHGRTFDHTFRLQ